MSSNTKTNTRRRLDLLVDEDLAAYAHDRAFRHRTSVSWVVERALRHLRDTLPDLASESPMLTCSGCGERVARATWSVPGGLRCQRCTRATPEQSTADEVIADLSAPVEPDPAVENFLGVASSASTSSANIDDLLSEIGIDGGEADEKGGA